MQAFFEWFRWLNDTTGINLTIFYDAFDRKRFIGGFFTTLQLAASCIVCSVLIGIAGAWLQGSRLRLTRRIVYWYIQFFRNTPPLVQLYFFYFGIGAYLKTTAGVPMVSNISWAILGLSMYAGAFNVEIFRSGIESVPKATVEAAESFGFSRLQAYRYIVLPLAFRVCLPALNNNLVNLVKTTSISFAIAVPEMLYVSAQIWSDSTNVKEMMNVLLVCYVGLVGLFVYAMHRWERAMRVPGYGHVSMRPRGGALGLRSPIPQATDLPVLLPAADALARRAARERVFGNPLATLDPRHAALLLVAILLLAGYAQAQASPARLGVVDTLWKWTPLLAKGFAFNIAISAIAMAGGTVVGTLLGIAQVSRIAWVRKPAWFVTHFFRNAPWLVLLFYCMFLLPFKFTVFGVTIPLPDWVKATFGLSLPVMANMSEIVRGAIQSIPTGQWESASSFAFSRRQTLWMIILPQCIKRMLPPWMNLYSILTVGTVLVSVVGVSEVMTLAGDVLGSENRADLLMPVYLYILVWFFLYCYPIARWTVYLERKYAVNF